MLFNFWNLNIRMVCFSTYLIRFHYRMIMWSLSKNAFFDKNLDWIIYSAGVNVIIKCSLHATTDYRLFYWNPDLLGLDRQIGQINCGAFGVISAKVLGPILLLLLLCLCFPLFNRYFHKKLSLYIHILNIYLGLGFKFEFGPQKNRHLAFVCP